MPDIFDELNEDMRAERARALAKRYGWLGILALVLVAGGVGGWEAWRQHRQSLDERAASPFLAAMHTADALPPDAGSGPRDAAAAAFAAIAKTAPDGYRTLARLREAALRWDAGNSAAAFTLWDAVAADPAADPLLQQLASLLWAEHAVDSGDPAAVTTRTAKLEGADNPYRPLAQEVDATLALRQGDKDRAADILRRLTSDPVATENMRNRAAGMLSLIGAPAQAGG